MKEETLAPAVGFGLVLEKTAIMSRDTLNRQTPHLLFRQHSESPDTTMTLQATKRISRHHTDSSGNTANLQTTQ